MIRFSLLEIYQTFIIIWNISPSSSFLSEFIIKNRNRLKINNNYKFNDVYKKYLLGKLFGRFRLICDLIIDYPINDLDISRLLLDFKYKILSSDKKNLNLSQTDFYQMFAYSQSGEKKVKYIILLYPKSEIEGINFDEIYVDNENCIRIYIKSIDLEHIFQESDRYKREMLLIKSLNERCFNINR